MLRISSKEHKSNDFMMYIFEIGNIRPLCLQILPKVNSNTVAMFQERQHLITQGYVARKCSRGCQNIKNGLMESRRLQACPQIRILDQHLTDISRNPSLNGSP